MPAPSFDSTPVLALLAVVLLALAAAVVVRVVRDVRAGDEGTADADPARRRRTPEERSARIRQRYADRHPTARPTSTREAEQRLRELRAERDRGAITDQQYAAARAAIVEDLGTGPDRFTP